MGQRLNGERLRHTKSARLLPSPRRRSELRFSQAESYRAGLPDGPIIAWPVQASKLNPTAEVALSILAHRQMNDCRGSIWCSWTT